MRSDPSGFDFGAVPILAVVLAIGLGIGMGITGAFAKRSPDCAATPTIETVTPK